MLPWCKNHITSYTIDFIQTGPEPKFRKKLITYDNVDCESADDSAHNLSNDNVDCESADDLADDTVDDCDNE